MTTSTDAVLVHSRSTPHMEARQPQFTARTLLPLRTPSIYHRRCRTRHELSRPRRSPSRKHSPCQRGRSEGGPECPSSSSALSRQGKADWSRFQTQRRTQRCAAGRSVDQGGYESREFMSTLHWMVQLLVAQKLLQQAFMCTSSSFLVAFIHESTSACSIQGAVQTFLSESPGWCRELEDITAFGS